MLFRSLSPIILPRPTYKISHNLSKLTLSLYALLITPYFVVHLLSSMGHWEVDAHPYFLQVISVLLFHTNSVCNVLMYGYSNKDVRKIIFQLVARFRLCPSHDNNDTDNQVSVIYINPSDLSVSEQSDNSVLSLSNSPEKDMQWNNTDTDRLIDVCGDQ